MYSGKIAVPPGGGGIVLSYFMTREWILCSIKCQHMQSNPLKYALESLKYAQYALLIQNMQVYRIT
jgi:hypothetical protein